MPPPTLNSEEPLIAICAPLPALTGDIHVHRVVVANMGIVPISSNRDDITIRSHHLLGYGASK